MCKTSAHPGSTQRKHASLSSSTWSRRFCSFEFTPLLRPSTSPAELQFSTRRHATSDPST